MGAFTLIIDNVDFSDYIQQETDITETLRKVFGNGQRLAVDGTTIPDLIANKLDPGFRLMPMTRDKYAALVTEMEKETVTLQYTSIKYTDGTLRTIKAIPMALAPFKYGTQWSGQRVYDGSAIKFEEV